MLLYDILEDANGTEEIVPGHEDGNYRRAEVISIDPTATTGPSGHARGMHTYKIVTAFPFKEEYVEGEEVKTRDSSAFFPGQNCILCYEEKNHTEDLEHIRKDQLFTVMSVKENNGCFELRVTSKEDLQMSKKVYIEMNYKKIDSQSDNLNFPGEIILTKVSTANREVTIKFKNKAPKASAYYIAYRKADCDDNTEWTYVKCDSEEVTLKDVDAVDYFVRAMYYDIDDDEFSFFSPEVLMNFY